MADNVNEQFKTTLMGGYDKEDVLEQFKQLKDTSEAEKNKLLLQIDELNKAVKEKDSEIEKLNSDIKEKYQSYIDNYDTIGKIVYETRIQSDKTLKDANAQKDKIISEADTQAREKVDKAQLEVQKILLDGKRHYEVLQEEINELIMLVNQVQHKFMKSFKAIHEISNTMEDDPFGDIDLDDNGDFDYDESDENGISDVMEKEKDE